VGAPLPSLRYSGTPDLNPGRAYGLGRGPPVQARASRERGVNSLRDGSIRGGAVPHNTDAKGRYA